jgi:hypothetical protein
MRKVLTLVLLALVSWALVGTPVLADQVTQSSDGTVLVKGKKKHKKQQKQKKQKKQKKNQEKTL